MGTPVPAPFGVRAARPVFAALYGRFTPYRPLDGLSEDAHSLFRARSENMGWLTSDAASGLWGMNDAEVIATAHDRDSRFGWFQVTATEQLIPVQPFLRCVSDVIQRLGEAHIDAVRILLPDNRFTERIDPRNWFADCDPASRASVRITLGFAAGKLAGEIAREMAEAMRSEHAFDYESFSLDDNDHLVLARSGTGIDFPASPYIDDRQRVTFRGVLPEWSLDAIGWTAAYLANLCARHGVTAPLAIAVGTPQS